MSSTLRSTISQLATDFATHILAALREASIQEILAETGAQSAKRVRAPRVTAKARAAAPAKRVPTAKKRDGRLTRRSPEQIGDMVDRIVDLLAANPEGLRSEQIREMLGVDARELPRPLAEALDAKRVSKEGEKRATTYHAKGGGKGRRGPGRKGKRGTAPAGDELAASEEE